MSTVDTICDQKGEEISIGSPILSIEVGWNGQVKAIEDHNGDVMLRCVGINWIFGGLDEDDIRCYSPSDVIVSQKKPKSPHPANFL